MNLSEITDNSEIHYVEFLKRTLLDFMQISKSPARTSFHTMCKSLTYGIAGVQQDLGWVRADIVDQQIAYLVTVEDLVSCNKGNTLAGIEF